MRFNLAVIVTTEREEGRTIYHCGILRGTPCSSRDANLSAALVKLAGKARKAISGWIESGKPNRVNEWLYDPAMRGSKHSLQLTLRDRTLRLKLFLITMPLNDRWLALAHSIPDVTFELSALTDLEPRALDVYTQWCQQQVKDGNAGILTQLSTEGDVWLESLEVEVEARVRTKKRAKNILAALFGQGPVSGSEELNKVGQCLDYMVSEFSPAIGRKEIVDEIDHILTRPDRQGVLLVGPSAVGKTAILQECVMRRTGRYEHRRGAKPQTWWISPQRLVSGMMYLGQWEQRWLAILREATKRDHILYFEDLVGLYTAGLTRDSRLCAADVLKSFLSEHRVRIVGETTPEELAVLRRRDRSLSDRFHLVHVPVLSPSDTLPILLEATSRTEITNRAYFHPAVVPMVIQQQEVLAPNRAFPGKAIELVKSVGVSDAVVHPTSLLYHLHQRTGTNLRLLYGHLGSQEQIEHSLNSKVIGQPDATAALARVVIRFTQKLQPTDRPVGVLLFLGPTGVGKTESAKALTELLFNDQTHMIRIDMNEITTPLAAEQLVGTFDSPEGRLTSAVRRQPHAVILLDEIEKAHPDVFDYLLQVLGEGRLTDARGRVVDFRSAIIILTSNLGSTQQGAQLGFESDATAQSQAYRRAAERFFRPEFFNRIDEVIAFRTLAESDIRSIVCMQLRQLLSREGLKRRHVYVRIESGVLEQVVRVGYDKHLGARAVRRALESEIVQPLGDRLAELNIDSPVLMRVSHEAGRLDCRMIDMHQVAPPQTIGRPTLEELVDKAKAVSERFDARLAEAAGQLKSSQSETERNAHQLAYYTLHEHVFHCNSLLKAARYRLSSAAGPRLNPMHGTPSAVKRSSTSGRGAGTRRMLREWMADEDLRETIQREETQDAHPELSNEALTDRLLQQLKLAHAMLTSADRPRRWAFGVESLSRPGDNDESALYDFTHPFFMLPEVFFFESLCHCLDSPWHYEVTPVDGVRHYRLVSGVSVAALLQSVAGTYVVSRLYEARDLFMLRAFPIEPEMSAREVADAIAAQTPLLADNFRPTPAGQRWTSDIIRGSLAGEVNDFASGARMKLPSDEWQSQPTGIQWSEWWMNLLPLPPELELPPGA